MNFEKNENGGWIIPSNSILPDNVIVPDYSVVGDGITFGDGTTFGDEITFGDGTTFGNGTTFGDEITFGDGTTFGNGTTFGDRTTLIIPNVKKIICLSNIDGTGRQIIIVTDGIVCMVDAGCFRGTVDEFCAKAQSENKPYYVAIVRAAAEAMIKALNEKI